MEKYNKIRHTNKFSYLTTLFANLDALGKKHGETHLITDTRQKLQEFAGYEFMNAIRLEKSLKLSEIIAKNSLIVKRKVLVTNLGVGIKKLILILLQILMLKLII